MTNTTCFLCGKTGTLDAHCKNLGKFYPVHELCLLKKRCLSFQDRIEKLEEEKAELIKKNRQLLNCTYKNKDMK